MSEDVRPKFVVEAEEKFFLDPPESVELLKKDMLTLTPNELYRKTSTIPNAGLGLFTRVPIKRGQPITWYSGAYVSGSEYVALKKVDKDFRDYAQALDAPGRQVVLGNYRRDENGRLRKIPFEDLGTEYDKDGAMQFMNGKRWYDDPVVNVASVLVLGKKRKVRPNAVDIFGELERLIKAYPMEILRVAVATRDIPSNTELINVYGASYFDAIDEKSSESDDEEEEEEDDESIDLNSSEDDDDSSDDSGSMSISSSDESDERPRKKARYQCLVCNRNAFFQCSACKMARYCSTKCQAKSWLSAHQTSCSRLY